MLEVICKLKLYNKRQVLAPLYWYKPDQSSH